MKRVLEIRAAARAGVQIGLDDISKDELQAMLILDEEREKWQREQQEG